MGCRGDAHCPLKCVAIAARWSVSFFVCARCLRSFAPESTDWDETLQRLAGFWLSLCVCLSVQRRFLGGVLFWSFNCGFLAFTKVYKVITGTRKTNPLCWGTKIAQVYMWTDSRDKVSVSTELWICHCEKCFPQMNYLYTQISSPQISILLVFWRQRYNFMFTN